MLLTTKYNVNDIVFYFDGNIKSTTIRQIIIEEYDYHYNTDNGIFYECELFVTKDETKKRKQRMVK